MTNQELEKYRIQLFRDAAGMEKKPDRTPLVSFFVTWKILDSPYKLTEAMNDYDKMEQVVRHHQEAYGFDTMFDFGTRNPYRVAQAMSSPHLYRGRRGGMRQCAGYPYLRAEARGAAGGKL